MPEGPEIRRSADVIAEVLENQQLVDVQIGLPRLKQHQPDLVGQQVLRVTSWGKAMLIHLENALTIYSHNQLYGVWKVVKKGALTDTKRSLRLGLHTDTHSALLYSASDISVWPTQRITEQPLLNKLGPDVLSDKLTATMLAERLKSDKFKRKRLSRLYLDQHFLAGVGNYLRSEILFFAGLHPDLTPAQLSQAKITELSQQSLQVCQRSYKTKGYTVSEDMWRSALAKQADYEKSRFMAFDRESLPCRICATPIERLERNGRRLYICPTCQAAH